MRNPARASRRVQRKNALATKRRSRRDAKHNQIYSNVQEMAPKSAAIVRSEPKLRITLPMQAQIIALFVKGYSLSEISRQTHRARQTVTKICRSEDVQAKIQELRARLLGESDDWLESINFAVTHETDARLACKLSEAFGIIPTREKNALTGKQNDWDGVRQRRTRKTRAQAPGGVESQGSAIRPRNGASSWRGRASEACHLEARSSFAKCFSTMIKGGLSRLLLMASICYCSEWVANTPRVRSLPCCIKPDFAT
jgi:hypothetical protein